MLATLSRIKVVPALARRERTSLPGLHEAGPGSTWPGFWTAGGPERLGVGLPLLILKHPEGPQSPQTVDMELVFFHP